MRHAAAQKGTWPRLIAVLAAISMVFSLMVIVAGPALGDPPPEGPDTITVDGDQYTATQKSGPVSHFETPETNPTSASTSRNVWTGNGSEHLPCPNGIHWIDNTQLLTISNCLGDTEPEPDLAKAKVLGLCIDEEFIAKVTLQNASVTIDLDGNGSLETSVTTTSNRAVTAAVGASIAWQAAANLGAEFEGTAPSGSLTVLDCVEDQVDHVRAVLPTIELSEACEVEGTLTIPDIEGVIYRLNGGVIAAGVHVGPISGTLTVEAETGFNITNGGDFPIVISISAAEDCENLADSEGAIVIRKLVTQGSDTTREFTFNTDDFTVADNTLAHGGQASADVNPGDYAVSEVVPAGWALQSAVCESTDSGDTSTPANIDISADEIVTCTFINHEAQQVPDVRPQIDVTKTANVNTAAPGETVTFTFVISNPSATEPVKISSIVDDVFGALVGDADCMIGVTLAAGTSCQFTFTWMVSTNDVGIHTNVVVVIGVDVDNPDITVTDDDSEVVEVDDVEGIIITPEQPAGPVTPGQPAGPVTPVDIPDIVSDTDVEADELPFTGIESDRLIGVAVMLLGGGVLLLTSRPRRQES